MAAGIPISMIPRAPYELASRKLVEIYRAKSAGEAARRCLRNGIDYLLVTPIERKGHPDFEPLIGASPELFQPVFRNATVSIYHVEGAKH